MKVFVFTILCTSGVWGALAQSPTVVQAPLTQAVHEGATVPLTITAAGALPLTYTWFKNYKLVPYYSVTSYSTNCTIVLTNMTPDQACEFNIQVSNAYGYAPGTQVAVAVIAAGIETNGFAMSVYGLTNSIWRIDYSTNVNAGPWITLTNLPIPMHPPYNRFVDLEATNGSRFYRVIPTVF